MSRDAIVFLATTLLVSASSVVRADDDPCAAISGDPTASVALRLACHRVVPFSDAVRHNVLDGIEDNLRNWVPWTPAYLAGAVPSGEPLDIFTDLTGPGSFLRTHMFQSDYDFHVAVINELFGALQNRHNAYVPDQCYNHWFFNPLALSSTTRFGNEQIVFVDLVSLPDPRFDDMTPAAFYRDVSGGPDVTPYDGLKVVSINGVAAAEAVRAYGDRLNHTSNPGSRFNMALRMINHRGLGLGRNDLPLDDDAADMVYVFEDRAGRRIGPVSIPLRPRTPFAGTDAEEYRQACETPDPALAFPLVDQPQLAPAPVPDEWPLAAWGDAASPTPAPLAASSADGRPGGRFFDMPPGGPGLDTRLVAEFPYAATAVRVYDVGEEGDEAAVAIELPSFEGDDPNWLLGVAAGVNRACDKDVDHLILDLRQNTGGANAASNMLTFFLFEPDQTRIAAHDPILHLQWGRPEQFRRTPYSVSLVLQSFQASQILEPFGVEFPQAIPLSEYLDLSGNPLTPAFYDSVEEVDFGGGVVAEYWERVYLNTWAQYPDFAYPVNQCPGRFQGDRLIVLGDGTSQSAAPIWVKTNRDRVAVITSGGDAASSVPTTLGQRFGGTVLSWGVDGIAQLHQALVALAWGILDPALPPLPFLMPALPLQRAPFLREVQMQFEQTQAYETPFSDVLTRSREVEADATIETWVYNRARGQELDRYGYVYSKAIRAAKKLHPWK